MSHYSVTNLTSSSGLGGGGGKVDLSILRSAAFFWPALDFAFFPMVYCFRDAVAAATDEIMMAGACSSRCTGRQNRLRS